MAARISRFRCKAERARIEKAARFEQLALELFGPHDSRVDSLRGDLLDEDALETEWDFALVGVREQRYVLHQLKQVSRRPMQAALVWSELLCHMTKDGSITKTRMELADLVGVSSSVITEVMNDLVEVQAIEKYYDKRPGMRGKGQLCYKINPWLSSRLPKTKRNIAQKTAAPIIGYERPVVVSSTE